MTYINLLLVTIVAVSSGNIEAAPQFFAGIQPLPGGGISQQAGYQAGPAWGSLSQSYNPIGLPRPIAYSGGVNAYNPAGTGVGGSWTVQSGSPPQGFLRGQFGHQMGNHYVNFFAQHSKNVDQNFRRFESNSAGINYSHKNGAGAFIRRVKTNGLPAQGTIGGSFPFFVRKNGRVSLTGDTTFGHGMKPIPQIGIHALYRF